MQVLQSAEKGDVYKVADHVILGGLDVNMKLYKGQTMLVAAILNNRQELTHALLSWGAKPSIPGCRFSQSHVSPLYPLQAALEIGNAEIIANVLMNGAQSWQCKFSPKQLIDFAIAKNDPLLLEYILHDIHQNCKLEKNSLFAKALLDTVDSRNLKLCKVIINSGVNLSRVYKGMLPLVLAAEAEDVQMFRLLIESGSCIDGGATITQQLNKQPTPICVAVQHGLETALQFLLAQGADANCAIHRAVYGMWCTALNSSPLHLAVLTGKPVMVCALIKYGACVNSHDSSGNTPLHIACRHPSLLNIVKLLIRKGMYKPLFVHI